MAQNNVKNPTPLKPILRETARVWRRLLYSKIENIFIYENLPQEIPTRLFNLMLFKTGKVVFYKIGDKYLVQPFSYNDILNWYYVPLKGRVVNPYLPIGHQNWEFKIEDECILYNSSPDILNYRMESITSDLIFKTANQLAENDISYYCIQRNSRLIALFSAETDLQKREMDKIINKMYEGETDITMLEDIVSHVHANPLTQNSTRNTITELIEFQQYVLANFYHSFGINSNYNLKREQLNSDEINVNQEVLRLNIEDMLKCREDGVEKINEKFGLNITVSLNEKLYATLLQQANLFQNGTIDPETGLQETEYVDEENPNKQFQNGTESENNNAKENIKDSDTRNSDNRDSNYENSKENSETYSNSSSRDERKSGSDSDNISDDGSSRTNSEETDDTNRGTSDNTERDRKEENSENDNESSKPDRNEQDSNTENVTKTEPNERDMQDNKNATNMETNSDDNSEHGGTNSGDSSRAVININITNAESVDVKTEESNVSFDEKTFQNETESEEE